VDALKKIHLLLITLAGVIFLLFIGFRMSRPVEPEYKGRRITDWITDLNEPPPKYDAAAAAVREMKQVALPIIELRLMEGHDRSQKEGWLALWYHRTGLGRRYSKAYLREADLEALRVIGKDSIPVLENLIETWDGRRDAANLLAELDALEVLDAKSPPMEMSIIKVAVCDALGTVTKRQDLAAQILLRLTTDQEADTRISAIYALGELAVLPGKVIPRFTELLEHGGKQTRLAVIVSLPAYGTNAMAAIPALQKIAAGENPELKEAAQETLDQLAKPPVP